MNSFYFAKRFLIWFAYYLLEDNKFGGLIFFAVVGMALNFSAWCCGSTFLVTGFDVLICYGGVFLFDAVLDVVTIAARLAKADSEFGEGWWRRSSL